MNHSQTANFIWNIADLIRDHFKRSKYPDVILPFTVLRHLDCVLAPTKKSVLETHAKFEGRLSEDALDTQLRRVSGFVFYNTSKFDFERLLNDQAAIHQLQGKLNEDIALQNSFKVNPPETARLTFDQVTEQLFAEMVDSYYEFYKQVTDDSQAKQRFFDWLYSQYRRHTEGQGKE